MAVRGHRSPKACAPTAAAEHGAWTDAFAMFEHGGVYSRPLHAHSHPCKAAKLNCRLGSFLPLQSCACRLPLACGAPTRPPSVRASSLMLTPARCERDLSVTKDRKCVWCGQRGTNKWSASEEQVSRGRAGETGARAGARSSARFSGRAALGRRSSPGEAAWVAAVPRGRSVHLRVLRKGRRRDGNDQASLHELCLSHCGCPPPTSKPTAAAQPSPPGEPRNRTLRGTTFSQVNLQSDRQFGRQKGSRVRAGGTCWCAAPTTCPCLPHPASLHSHIGAVVAAKVAVRRGVDVAATGGNRLRWKRMVGMQRHNNCGVEQLRSPWHPCACPQSRVV